MSKCTVVHGWGKDSCISSRHADLIDFFKESNYDPKSFPHNLELYWILILDGPRIMAVGIIDLANQTIKDILVQKFHRRQRFGSGILFHLAQLFPFYTFQVWVSEDNWKAIRFFSKTARSDIIVSDPFRYHYVFQT